MGAETRTIGAWVSSLESAGIHEVIHRVASRGAGGECLAIGTNDWCAGRGNRTCSRPRIVVGACVAIRKEHRDADGEKRDAHTIRWGRCDNDDALRGITLQRHPWGEGSTACFKTPTIGMWVGSSVVEQCPFKALAEGSIPSRPTTVMPHYFYLARCKDDSLYAGTCIDLAEREAKHNAGTGAKYTRSRRPVKIIYHEEFSSLGEARKREAAVKKMKKKQKLQLMG